jgi:nicotinamidase-related amidase
MKGIGARGGAVMELERNDTTFLIIDIQERLARAMPQEQLRLMVENVRRLGAAAAELGVPVVATEQYPKGLGPSLEEVSGAVEGWAPLEKTSFDCCGAPGFAIATKSVVIAGMETHVCVYQTARSLASRGHTVHVVSDAVVSRHSENREVGLELMRHAGAIVTSTEAVLFDLLKGSDAPEFKAVSNLVR